MIREIDLSGEWEFAAAQARKEAEEKRKENRFLETIALPGTMSQAKKGTPSDVRETGHLTDPYAFSGYALYQKTVTLPKDSLGKTIVLFLERTRLTAVWVNDAFAGKFDSLNAPHCYDLTELIKNPTFRLTVLVQNTDYPTAGGHLTSPDTQTNWNGITGKIALQIFDSCFIRQVSTYPDIKTKSVRVCFTAVNTTKKACAKTVRVLARLEDISGDTGKEAPADRFSVDFPIGESKTELTYFLGEDAALWSEYNPQIYRLSLTFDDTGETAVTTFGLREFCAGQKEFLINGVPTFLRGKHDGMVFPLSGAAPTDVSAWIRVMGIAKSYGINHYRFHTCCPPEAAFAAADVLGIYLEPELPFWGTLAAPQDEDFNKEEQEYLIAEGWRILKTFGNHASFCMMSLGNELWGSKEEMAKIISAYKKADDRHLYTQGSNNFQHMPVILPEDDFFVGVRLSKNRLFRGSYGMCDAPLGHVQTDMPSTLHNYDAILCPESDSAQDAQTDGASVEEIEIQYGTGVKKVSAAASKKPLIPHIPVISHEIGQYAIYPNFREMEKYTGVLKPKNFEVFKDRLEQKGMLDLADDFFTVSGKLAVSCYKEELEAAARTKNLAGYQILDLQDFPGQGTALVGILDAFMENKGLISKEEWTQFCSDTVLLAEFPSYVLTAGKSFSCDLAIRCTGTEKLGGKTLCYALNGTDVSGQVPIPDGAFGLCHLGQVQIPVPESKSAYASALTLSVPGTDRKNTYELFIYPPQEAVDLSAKKIERNGVSLSVTTDFEETCRLLSEGNRVLHLPNEVAQSIPGFYCADFWCYPMFRDICQSMNKPVAVGTMGLLIQENHPALAGFLSRKYSTPQWYHLVSAADCAILDEATDASYRPIVQMVDNFERNHKLGILFEGRAGSGKLMVCTSRLSATSDRVEVRQFTQSLLAYLTGQSFDPAQSLDLEKLRSVFTD